MTKDITRYKEYCCSYNEFSTKSVSDLSRICFHFHDSGKDVPGPQSTAIMGVVFFFFFFLVQVFPARQRWFDMYGSGHPGPSPRPGGAAARSAARGPDARGRRDASGRGGPRRAASTPWHLVAPRDQASAWRHGTK